MGKTLFIIGNGFDISNGLQTSYSCFRDYLVNEIGLSNGIEPTFVLSQNSILAPNEKQDAYVIVNMIDSASRKVNRKVDWSCFEEILGQLKYEHLWGKKEKKEELGGIIVHAAFSRLEDFFKRWISTIDVSQAKKDKSILFGEQDIFLSFNYTRTLEDVYHVDPQNICHIHGACGGPDLIFGHKAGNKKEVERDSALRQVEIVRDSTVKNTDICYYKNRKFFNRIDETIEVIISKGFSYSTVDMFYIKKLVKKLNKNATWYIHRYRVKDAVKYMIMVRRAGFKGKIKLFIEFCEII